MGIKENDLHLLSMEPNDIKGMVAKVECKKVLFTLAMKVETIKDIECLKVP